MIDLAELDNRHEIELAAREMNEESVQKVWKARYDRHYARLLSKGFTDRESDYNAQVLAEREMNEETPDLLDLVDEREPDNRSEGQVNYMNDLITNVTELDAELGRQAREYTDRMTREGRWTTGREGNASAWITRLLAKLDRLRAAQRRTPVGPAPTVEIPAGRYAINDGEVKCYSIDYGREGTKWAGFLFLARISSDDRFPIRNREEKARILAAIAADVDASAILAGLTLRQCRRCGRTLSDTKNPYFSVALGPECGNKV